MNTQEDQQKACQGHKFYYYSRSGRQNRRAKRLQTDAEAVKRASCACHVFIILIIITMAYTEVTDTSRTGSWSIELLHSDMVYVHITRMNVTNAI